METPVIAQRTEFYKEDLHFYLEPNYFITEGFYYFSNNDSANNNHIIFYPFPTGNKYGKVDSVSVFDNTFKKEISFSQQKNNTGISFPLTLEGYGFRKIKIVYRQRLYGNIAEYILTTTKNWGKPLETANYSLTIPVKIRIDSLSYPADSVKFDNKRNTYYWNKKNFLPKENFMIYFRLQN